MFVPLYKWLRKRGYCRDDLMFGVSGSTEFSLMGDERVYFYDFLIKPLKVLIEYNGVLFHARNETDTLLFGHNALDIMKKDQLKEEVALRNGFRLFVVWSDDIEVLDKLQTFIYKVEEEIDAKI